MKLTITGRHRDLSDRLKQHVTDKAERLERYHDGILNADIILDSEGQGHRAEMIISVRQGNRIVAKETHDDLYAAIDLLMDKVGRLLKKRKQKAHDRRTKSGRLVTPAVPISETDDDLLR